MNKIINILNERERGIEALAHKIDKETIFLCVGSHKVINDAIGPMVGTILEKSIVPTAGSMAVPINGINLESRLEQIKALYPNSNLIVVDAAIGDEDQVGNVYYRPFGATPGSASRKNGKFIGHASIIAVVSSSINDSISNKKSSYEDIGRISDYIAKFIKEATILANNKIHS